MRLRLAPLLILLATACSAGVASLDDKGEGDGTDGDADTDVGADTDGDPGTDTDADTDGEDPVEEPEPSTEDWAGEWFAFVNLEAETEGGWGGGQDITCDGEMVFDFADNGDVEGEGVCSVGGWAEATLTFEGEVDEDGNLDGVLVFSQEWVGESELDVAGAASDESQIATDVEGTLVLGGWGGDYEVPLFGVMTLERE